MRAISSSISSAITLIAQRFLCEKESRVLSVATSWKCTLPTKSSEVIQVHNRNIQGSVVNSCFLSWSWLQPSLVPHFPSCHSLPITQSVTALNNLSCHPTCLLHTILVFLFWYHENSLGQEVLLISPLDPWYLITCLGEVRKASNRISF